MKIMDLLSGLCSLVSLSKFNLVTHFLVIICILWCLLIPNWNWLLSDWMVCWMEKWKLQVYLINHSWKMRFVPFFFNQAFSDTIRFNLSADLLQVGFSDCNYLVGLINLPVCSSFCQSRESAQLDTYCLAPLGNDPIMHGHCSISN